MEWVHFALKQEASNGKEILNIDASTSIGKLHEIEETPFFSSKEKTNVTAMITLKSYSNDRFKYLELKN